MTCRSHVKLYLVYYWDAPYLRKDVESTYFVKAESKKKAIELVKKFFNRKYEPNDAEIYKTYEFGAILVSKELDKLEPNKILSIRSITYERNNSDGVQQPKD